LNQVSHTPIRAASRRLGRAASFIRQAEEQLTAASRAATDRHCQRELYGLALDLRGLSQPLVRIGSSLKAGDRQ